MLWLVQSRSKRRRGWHATCATPGKCGSGSSSSRLTGSWQSCGTGRRGAARAGAPRVAAACSRLQQQRLLVEQRRTALLGSDSGPLQLRSQQRHSQQPRRKGRPLPQCLPQKHQLRQRRRQLLLLCRPRGQRHSSWSPPSCWQWLAPPPPPPQLRWVPPQTAPLSWTLFRGPAPWRQPQPWPLCQARLLQRQQQLPALPVPASRPPVRQHRWEQPRHRQQEQREQQMVRLSSTWS